MQAQSSHRRRFRSYTPEGYTVSTLNREGRFLGFVNPRMDKELPRLMVESSPVHKSGSTLHSNTYPQRSLACATQLVPKLLTFGLEQCANDNYHSCDWPSRRKKVQVLPERASGFQSLFHVRPFILFVTFPTKRGCSYSTGNSTLRPVLPPRDVFLNCMPPLAMGSPLITDGQDHGS